MNRSIPSYELYGDLVAGRAPDPIHLEQIRERSIKHDWTIGVHSHRRLAQIFLFRSPGVYLTVGEVTHFTTHPTLLVVTPGIQHGFRFSEDVVGDVLSIRVDAASDLRRDCFAAFETPTSAVFSRPDTPHFDDIVVLFDQLRDAYHGLGNNRVEIMETLVDLITLYLAGDQSSLASPIAAKVTGPLGRQVVQAQAFCALLEESYRQPWTVAHYASRMGLSASHLTRICRAVLDAPPNALVRQRRILEAKRLLEYTPLPLSEIAHRSGFRDTAFFSRTFKVFVGVSPNAFRSNMDR
ncbi:helix-turn-helix domain-containing protein [Cognatiyoonia sp. IB215182]|uniref:helix-turn-helix domain-containing protein n=1 Tax=Cognatiyoonia sp. IB215182 TaxID=3097353 RepID=UPI002A0D6635|nr:helix-turn-helix domain-containing protein [Cognatiyoonia sp. IB215182]MDX8354011.1 helix-turn-helix domain-containing protein [Cognatiyoonia sp. IB215182]